MLVQKEVNPISFHSLHRMIQVPIPHWTALPPVAFQPQGLVQEVAMVVWEVQDGMELEDSFYS
jgi:hypothetical protein